DEWTAELRIEGQGVAGALEVGRVAPAPGLGLGAALIRQAFLPPGQMDAAVSSLARRVQTQPASSALSAYGRYCPILPELPELMDRLRCAMSAGLVRLASGG
ncbi:MAG TPA: hypothetical protein P5137_10930, partial [Candidatus Brocadiia bacterium]|nr:hypothetical protein [Candidatus Brocadiia bacterium]